MNFRIALALTLPLTTFVATPSTAQSRGPAPKTEQLVADVPASDKFEIQSSELAEQRVTGPVKTFAQRMVADHTKTSRELKTMIDSGKINAGPAKAPDNTLTARIDKLKALEGAEFTKQYLSDQVAAHKTAVDLFKSYADGGDNPDLKAWAAKTLPTLEEHLKMAQDLAAKA